MAKFNQQVPRSIKQAAVSGFGKLTFEQKEAIRQDTQKDLGLKLEQLRVRDISWRVRARGPVTWIAYSLLFIQNAYIAYLVWYSLHLSHVPSGYFQFMTALIAATLTESAYVIRLIVTWLFKEISYTKEISTAKDTTQNTDP